MRLISQASILANRSLFTKRNTDTSEEINNKKKVALSARAIDKMKIGDADQCDIGEYIGLRVVCGKTGLKSFVYRYRSPIDNSLKKITLGNYPNMSLAEAGITEAKWILKGEDRAKNHNFQKHQLWPKDMEDWNQHDLRRTIRTNLPRFGCPTDVAEAVLGHSKKGIEGTYNLNTYEEECAEWLQK